MYVITYTIAVNTITMPSCMGILIPKNIDRYSPTVRSDGPNAITLNTTLKTVETIGATQRNFRFVKKTINTDNTGIRMKIMVQSQFNPNSTGLYHPIMVYCTSLS